MAFKVKSKKVTSPKEKNAVSKNPYFVDGKDMSKVPIYYLEGDYGLTPAQEKALWQHGVDTGVVWQLQGWYGRNASAMLQDGYLKYPKKKTSDYYGNPIPTQKEIKSGNTDEVISGRRKDVMINQNAYLREGVKN